MYVDLFYYCSPELLLALLREYARKYSRKYRYLQEFVVVFFFFLLHASQLDTEVRYFIDSTITSRLLWAKQ